MNLEAKRTMYPPNVGFRYETGGMMDNLRALTADRIRQFHRDMYQPKNLCLALVGEVDHDSLLDTLDDFESSIINDIPPPSAPFKRPWVDSAHAPPLEKTVVKKVEFPEEDESMGEISIGFFGPPYSDTLACAALEVLLTYVAGSSASLFDNVIVEKEQLASGVTYEIESRPETRIEFGLSGVATERLDEVEKRFFEIAKDAARKPFDMQYLKDCLHRITTQIRFSSESSGSFFADQIIADHLFGKRDGSQLRELASLKKWHDELMEWDDQRWREFFSKWIANAHHISVLGVPSANLSKKLKADEEARVKAQQELLGEAGLRRLAEKLEQAKAENDREIPREILEKFKTPGTDSIHFFPTTTARSGLAKKLGNLDNDVQKLVDQDDTTLPLFIHFEDIPSNFVRLSLVLNTHSIPVSLRPLLSVYLMNFFATPILRDGQKIDFEKIVTELEKDTIFYDIDDGSQIGNSELLKISFRVEPEKYEAAIRWIRTMLFDSIFDETRLKATITKMLADIPEAKRSGSTMSSAVQKMIHFSSLSSVRAQSTLVKALYLKRIRHLLASSPQTVIDNLEKIRSTLATFSNFRVLVIADLHKLKRPVSAWKALIANLDTSAPFLQPLDSVQTTLSPAGKSPGSSAFLVPMSTIDSSFALLTAKGVDSHEHPHLPGLMVAIAYLDAVEGPLWGAVRGTGLAYGTGFSYSLTSGLLLYRIYRSPNAYNAWKTSKEIIKGFVTGEKPLESYAMEGAISSIVVGFADEQPTMSSAAQLSFVNQVIRGIPKDWSQRILKRVREVTEQDVKVVLERYLLPVFEPATSDLVVTCAPIMQEVKSHPLDDSRGIRMLTLGHAVAGEQVRRGRVRAKGAAPSLLPRRLRSRRRWG